MGISTLVFIFCAMGTYVAMQRLAVVAQSTVDALTRDDGPPVVLPPRDAALLRQAQSLYDEPAPFNVWGLLLVTAGILLIGVHIYPPMGLVLLLALAGILIRSTTLHRVLREVLLARTIPPAHHGEN